MLNIDILNINLTGYSYFNCNCCPYGYHIDLDFVRYCESISQEADRSGSIKRRKDRRRQRQSMEVLLGITPPLLANEQNYKVFNSLNVPSFDQMEYFYSQLSNKRHRNWCKKRIFQYFIMMVSMMLLAILNVPYKDLRINYLIIYQTLRLFQVLIPI